MLTGLATTFQGVVSWSGFLKAYSASRDWIESQATHPGRRGGKGSGERSNRPSRFACCVERGPARGAVNAGRACESSDCWRCWHSSIRTICLSIFQEIALLSVAVTIEATLVGAMCLSKKMGDVTNITKRSTREIRVQFDG